MKYQNLNSMVDALGNDEPFETIEISTIVFGNDAIETVEGSTLYVSPRNFLIGKKDLNDMILKGLDVEQMSFFKANFKNSKCLSAKFSKCNFAFADLSDADFGYSTFYNCDFSNADMSEAMLTKCKFTNCKFESTNFFKASIGCGDMRGQLFNKCNFAASSVNGSDFSDSKFTGCDMREADFSQSVLKNTRMEVSDLSYMNIESAYIVGFELFDCVVKGFDIFVVKEALQPYPNPRRCQWNCDLGEEQDSHAETDLKLLKKMDKYSLENFIKDKYNGSFLVNYLIFNEEKWQKDVTEMKNKMAKAEAEIEN